MFDSGKFFLRATRGITILCSDKSVGLEPVEFMWGERRTLLLTDGCVTLRLPCSNDVARVAEYGADQKLLEGIWIAGPFPDSDLNAWALGVVAEALAGWTERGGIHGGGVVIDEEQPFVGILYLAARDNDILEISYGVVPTMRGRGIATRALRLITAWAMTQGEFTSVELRIAENHAASRRVAEKAGFHFQKKFEIYVENTGETYIDLLYSFPPEISD